MTPALAFLFGLLLVATPALAGTEPPFERFELRTEHPIVQDTVSLRLGEGNGRHLLVITSPDEENVRVELFPPGREGAPGTTPARIDLPSDVIAFGTADLDADGRQALYFLTPRAVLRFEPADGSLREITRVQSIYRRPAPGRLLPVDFMRGDGKRKSPLLVLPDFDNVRAGTTKDGQLVRRTDLNGDERDDLILRYEGLDGEGGRHRLTLPLGRPARTEPES